MPKKGNFGLSDGDMEGTVDYYIVTKLLKW